MSEPAAVHSTFVIERTYPASPERIFAAFADPVKKRRWFAEGETFEVDRFEMDFRVGGIERARFRFKTGTPIEPGTPCANDTYYLDIVPNHRIVVAYNMSVAEQRISASLGTTEIFPAGQASKVIYTEQAAFFEGADGPAVRESGWQQLLNRLADELNRASHR
ncbi:MAG TPA: SRPBCC family protein [Steroidobacter sp.]|uniref:SRPBCC family protein n=1 Tax=Steroidobacter sp. TaxID=1978227 RepID=UPI002EDB1C85